MFRNKERGAALVEFALVLPLLLMILFGIIEFSILFYDKAVITNASREAAREWIVYRDGVLTSKLSSTQLSDIVANYTNNRLISISSSNPPVIETVPANPTAFTSGQQLKLTVKYTYDFVFLPGFMQGLMPSVTLDATTVMRAE